MNVELQERSLTTADFAAAAAIPTTQLEVGRDLKEPVIANKPTDAKKEGE